MIYAVLKKKKKKTWYVPYVTPEFDIFYINGE
jgi:hypothetical protein